MLKLNLGSGSINLEGYENIDLLDGKNAYPLEYESETVDEIRASHILEHFDKQHIRKVLRDWVNKLKPGGILKIAVPDFAIIAGKYAAGEQTDHNITDYVVGGQIDENDYHKMIFDEAGLRYYLEECGLEKIKPWKSAINDCASYEISLNLQGRKPAKKVKKIGTKIQAVMSMPRLGFTDNFFCAARTFPALGINIDNGTGVFWGQVLTRMIEKHLDDGTEYIITCDYDTWFRREHVIRLCQLMAENPVADAIVPVQIKREDKVPMFSIPSDDGKIGIKKVPSSTFDNELTPIVGGQFGLTIFRVSAFARLQKPWFIAHPDPDGGWGDGKIDEDIHFWHNFHDSGLKAYLATTINIGHLQMIATFPGSASNGWKPEQVYMTDVEKGRYPENAVPKITLLK